MIKTTVAAKTADFDERTIAIMVINILTNNLNGLLQILLSKGTGL